MILQFTHFHNFSSLLRLWSTTLNGLEFHQKILNDSMAVLLWQYDTIWQYFCDSMTAWPRMWLHHYDSMTDPLHAKFRRSGKKTWPPRKIASQIWTPKNQHASLHSTFWSRPCIGLLLCSWNITWPLLSNEIKLKIKSWSIWKFIYLFWTLNNIDETIAS